MKYCRKLKRKEVRKMKIKFEGIIKTGSSVIFLIGKDKNNNTITIPIERRLFGVLWNEWDRKQKEGKKYVEIKT